MTKSIWILNHYAQLPDALCQHLLVRRSGLQAPEMQPVFERSRGICSMLELIMIVKF